MKPRDPNLISETVFTVATCGQARAKANGFVEKGEGDIFSNQFLRASRDLDYSGRAVWEPFMFFIFLSFKTSPHLLQFFRENTARLFCCIAPEMFVDCKTSPDLHRTELSASIICPLQSD